jgi:hypothetical protein
MSVASLGFRKICLKRSVTGRYHITKAGILLYFASLPNEVSSGGYGSCTTFFVPFLFLFFPVEASSPPQRSLFLYRLAPHRGHLSSDLNVLPQKSIQWLGHALIFSTPIVNGLMTFFTWYVLAETEFGCGSTHDRRRNRSLKLQSDQLKHKT